MSLQRIETRLTKLEQATGINEPCAVCEHGERTVKRIEELAKQLGVSLSKPLPPEMPFICYYCLRVRYIKVGELSPEVCVLIERSYTAFEAGTLLCTPENSTLRQDIRAAINRLTRAEWGEHYAALEVLREERDQELEEVCAGLMPRRIYLCRVPGCECEYPKTEEQWRRKIERGLASRAGQLKNCSTRWQ